ncbi:hypothetical protein FSARC_3243 [Fusarium sarcochroum]|uniref:AB hydrolase-1 domain-containing protein n=1 Tax=Fusarium sarcochroum TaxID=1208366 RepID=A0A8H4XCQ1_9HYPO|nr:hypothetical protein FSARC_3243 [Fusarium sarcochroum]
MAALTTISKITVDDTDIFYRHAGPSDPSSPTILLLHGFPSSSHQFRNLLPLLANLDYSVYAPDLPGFGFTTPKADYVYTFANLASTIDGFVSALGLNKFALYIFDYGAPTGLRLALKRPEDIVAIISQNGNAYEEGFGTDFWAPVKQYWSSGSPADRNALSQALTIDAVKSQYMDGSPHPWLIEPESYTLDKALLDRPGNGDIQLDLFYDYRTNVELYPQFQEYFRSSGVPVLTMWGRNDTIFVPAGAEAYAKDVKKLETKWVDAGHFALETNEVRFAEEIDLFLKKYNAFR